MVENVAGDDVNDIDEVLSPLEATFEVARTLDDPPRFDLRGWAKEAPPSARQTISLRLRAEVLAAQRCAQCGRTPSEDGVRLSPVQKVPINWGGEPDRENLEPLCEECGIGRQQYFAKWDGVAEKIRRAVGFDDPRQRIGELLAAFAPEWVRADLIEAVACAQEHQDDWQRRVRDLRFLGWDYEQRNWKLDTGGRTWSHYRLVMSAQWPENIPAAIKVEALRRRQAR